jgi:hypothetical protein
MDAVRNHHHQDKHHHDEHGLAYAPVRRRLIDHPYTPTALVMRIG